MSLDAPAWDASVDEVELCFVDLEMTGLDAKQDRVVEVCIERVRGDIVESRVSKPDIACST